MRAEEPAAATPTSTTSTVESKASDKPVTDSATANPPGTDTHPAKVPVAEPHANAGFGNEGFFLRSNDDNFVLMVSGRLQNDLYFYEGGSKAPFNQFLPKRARIELFGTIMKHWDFQLGAEYDQTATPVATDVFLNANYTNYANVQFGQFDAPFTMENRTSDKWTDLQERSVVARWAIPENKFIGAMVWGQPDAKWAYWSLGIFNSEGMQQFTHRSNDFVYMGRGWIAPFGAANVDLLKNVWVGASFLSGNYAPSVANQLDRPTTKDSAAVTFFSGANGTLHTGQFGQTNKYDFELNAPVGPFVIKGEFMHGDEGLREIDTATPGFTRKANLSSNAYYARLSWFAWGDPLINGLAGMQNPPHLFGKLSEGKTKDALQLVAEFDHIDAHYSADLQAGESDKFVGDYGLNVAAFGVNYWYTKHIRLTGNFLYNMWDGVGPKPLATSPNSYEVTFRAALAL